MVGPTFKTMYLVSKSDLYDDNKSSNGKKNFKLSLQNGDICDGGMNVSVKPIKTRVKNKPLAKYTPNLDDIESEDKNENNIVLSEKKYTYDRPTPQSIELNTVRKKQCPNYAFQSEKNNFNKYSNDDNRKKSEAISSTYYDKSTPLSMVETEGKELSENESVSSDMNNYNNHDNGDIAQKQEDITTKNTEIEPKSYKNYKLKRLQKSYSKKLKKKFPDYQKSNKNSHHADLSRNHKDNQASPVNSDKYIQDIDEGYKLDDVDDDPTDPEVSNLKKRKIMHDIEKSKEDQWLGRIKSRLSDKRVQFKRKRDTIGYRINPDDISKSLIKPSDFSYLNETESADYLDKWKSLKELRKQPFKNKRFKLYR